MTGQPVDAATAAQVAAVAKVLNDSVIKPQDGPARKALLEAMKRDLVDKMGVRIPGSGERIATVRLQDGKRTVKVTNRVEFTAWVAANHPEWMEPAVRSVDEERLKNAMQATGAPIDPATGEIVPGVEVVDGDPYLVVQTTPEAPLLVMDAIRAGTLTALALPGGEAA